MNADQTRTKQLLFDVIVVGVGFAGLYAVYLFRERGFSVQGFRHKIRRRRRGHLVLEPLSR